MASALPSWITPLVRGSRCILSLKSKSRHVAPHQAGTGHRPGAGPSGRPHLGQRAVPAGPECRLDYPAGGPPHEATGATCGYQGEHTAQWHPGHPDEGQGHHVWAVRVDRTGFDCRAHQRRISRGQGQWTAAGSAQRGPRDIEADGSGSRDSKPPGQNRRESVDRENSGRLPVHAAPFHRVQRLGLSVQRVGSSANQSVNPVCVESGP